MLPIVSTAVQSLSALAGCFFAVRYFFVRKKHPEEKVVCMAFIAMFAAVTVMLGGPSISFPPITWALRAVGAIEAAGAVLAAVRRESFWSQVDRAVTATVFFLLSMF